VMMIVVSACVIILLEIRGETSTSAGCDFHFTKHNANA
jgi:hypothetical protein